MSIEIADFLIWLPLIGYFLVYFLLLRSSNIQIRNFLWRPMLPLDRKARGCFKATCITYPPEKTGLKCDIDPGHWDMYQNTDNACNKSKAVISQQEKDFNSLTFLSKSEFLRNVISIAALAATILIAILKGD